MARQVTSKESLETLWTELVYTEVRLLKDPLTQDLAPVFTTLIAEVETVEKEQRALWRGEYEAEAGVARVNYDLDGTANQFKEAKRASLLKRNPRWKAKDLRRSPEFTQYFPETPSRLIRRALSAQLKVTRKWPLYMAQDPDPEVLPFKTRVEEHIVQGDKALANHDNAYAATSNHRVYKINDLFERAQSARNTLHGELMKRAEEHKLGKDWVELFFKDAKDSGPNRAELRGKAEALLGFLAARKIELSEERRKEIVKTTKPDILDRWIALAATIQKADELFASPEKELKSAAGGS